MGLLQCDVERIFICHYQMARKAQVESFVGLAASQGNASRKKEM